MAWSNAVSRSCLRRVSRASAIAWANMGSVLSHLYGVVRSMPACSAAATELRPRAIAAMNRSLRLFVWRVFMVRHGWRRWRLGWGW